MKGLIGILALILSGSLQAAEHFLDQSELDSLTPNPDVPGVSRHFAEGVDPAAYTQLIVGSVSFFFAEDSKTKSIDADEMKTVSDAIKSAMIAAAADRREVVLTKGPKAALLNIAVTEISLQNKKRGLLGYTPVGFVVSTTANMAGLRIQLKDARIEGEAVDSVTGETIAVFRLDEIADIDGKKAMSWDDLVGSFQNALSTALGALTTD